MRVVFWVVERVGAKAALTHNILPDTKEKIEFTFGLYMRTFYCDPTGLFLSMLEI